jgi:hypothetical protein
MSIKSKEPEYVKNYNKSYYEKNKDKLLTFANQKKLCECCQKEYQQANFSRHIKSTIHKKCEEIATLKALNNQ